MDYDILVNKVLLKKHVLRQYSVWLENSEDIFNRIRGFIDSAAGDIVEDNELIRLLINIQSELKFDIGVCQFFNDKQSICTLSGNIIVNPASCIPPLRGGCEYRKKNQG